jgi:multidrug efflux pump subunit AcrA (membrane-fusion protein)
MKHFLFLLLISVGLNATEYYAKAEPVERYTIQSTVSGSVVFVDRAIEGKIAKTDEIIRIDDELDVKEFNAVTKKIKIVKKMISLNEATAKNLKISAQKKDANYRKILNLKTKSLLDKDREFYDLSATQNSYYQSLQSIETLKSQLEDLKLRRSTLEKSIREKRIAYPEYAVYKLLVKEGQSVVYGTPLLEIADIKHAKLTLFLQKEEADEASKKVIYLDGKKSDYHVDKIFFIADEQRISSYRTEIIIDAPKVFSNLIKVEFKDQ